MTSKVRVIVFITGVVLVATGAVLDAYAYTIGDWFALTGIALLLALLAYIGIKDKKK